MRILALDGVAEEGLIELRKEFAVDKIDKPTPDTLKEIIKDYDALIVRSATKVTKELLDLGTRLKIIGRAGVGVDNIDVQAATARGIIVLNSPDGNTIAATEHTLAMMIGLSRNIGPANESMHKGQWLRSRLVGVQLKGKTLGIIGLGRIGIGVAKRAQAFEMNILGYDPFVSEERASAMGITLTTLDDLIRQSDYVTLHLPLTPQTKGIISARHLGLMKPSARIINCARGGLIDEAALIGALKENRIAGAAIDVFEAEPLPADSPWRRLSNVLLTPHLGASTVEAQIGVARDVSRGLIEGLNNRPVNSAVNMPHIPKHLFNQLAPYLDLSERLGRTLIGLSGAINYLEVEIAGTIADSGLITSAVLKGLLSVALDDVNLVNAKYLAKIRGIEIKESRADGGEDFANKITVRSGVNEVTGALFGKEGRLVSINNFRVDVEPRARLLICPHINKPGVIGRIGTLLAHYDINISGMNVGKTSIEGRSLMILTIDNELPPGLLELIKDAEGIFDALLVSFH